MTNDLTNYNALRPHLRTGDVIAFSGRGFVSGGIRFFTHSPISHVGVVFECYDDACERRVILAESTVLTGEKGVQFHPLSERLRNYDGSAQWLELDDVSRALLDTGKMHDWLKAQDPCGYDYRGLAAFLARPIPGLGQLLHHGAVQAWFCSELVVEAFRQGGLLLHVEPDHASPQWLCSRHIFRTYPFVLIGRPFQIPNFNTV